MTQRINDKGVLRAAPATPGLLINLTQKAGVSQQKIFINPFSLKFTANCKTHVFVGPLKSEGFGGFV